MMNQTLHIGFQLQEGKYRITDMLGQGGFGITYLAEQVALGRKVAVKEFFMKDACSRDEFTSRVEVPVSGQVELVSQFRAKFIREARLIAEFEHAHIVKIYDVFEENGTAYYVMEHIDGGSLSSLVREKGPLPEQQALKYIREIGSALSYIHEKNILHLDVKPANILLRNNGQAVLIDFGISKHYDSGGHQTSSAPVGVSPGYAPIEQYRSGDVATFSPATDIYSLGATLYYLVCGTVPPPATEIVDADSLDRPSGMSDKVWSVIHQAMHPVVKSRPQSVADFLSLLDGVSKTADTGGQVPKPVGKRRGRTWLWILLGVLAAAMLVLILLLSGKLRKETVMPEPEEQTEVVVEEEVPTPAPSPTPSPSPSPSPAPATAPTRPPASSQPAEPVAETENTRGTIAGHEWVDLGLSVKWATCNLGANTPTQYGSFFAWGETRPKDYYSASNGNYKHQDGKYDKVNSKLEMEDDAARVIWGGSWRMPTEDECIELLTKCRCSWKTVDGVNGMLMVSKINGNSIFLPASGTIMEHSLNFRGSSGLYWSSSLDDQFPGRPGYLHFSQSGRQFDQSSPNTGHSIRPVTK